MNKLIFFMNLLFMGSQIFSITPVFAQSSSTLQKQVNDLQKTVQQLSDLVQKQNQKIESLTSNQKSDTPPEPKNNSETKSLGMWKYPVSSQAAKLLPDISVIGAFAGAYFQNEPAAGGEEEHAHASGHDPHRTGFNLQEIEVAFQSIIDPYVRADVFLSFQEEGVELEEAYITSLSGLPKGMQLKAGKYKVPFGRQNQKHLDTWAFVNNNLINSHFWSGEGFNELGLEMSYLFSTPFFLQAQFSFNQGDNEGNFDSERKQDFAYTGRLSASSDLTDNLTLLAGASASLGRNNTSEEGKFTGIYGGDLLLKWKPSKYKSIEWQTEYMHRQRNVLEGTESLKQNEGGISSYVVGNWNQHWGAGLRAEYVGMPAVEEKEFRLSPMLTFRPSEFLRLKAQYDMTRTLSEKTEHAAMLQMIFNMGPHGAHSF